MNWETTNSVLKWAGHGGDIGAYLKDGLIESRNTLPLMQRIGMSRNMKALRWVSTGSKWLGWAGNVGMGLSAILDYDKMERGEISEARFGYNVTGSAATIATGAIFGGVPGALVGGTVTTGQILYDAFNAWRQEFSWGASQMLNKLERSIPRQ